MLIMWLTFCLAEFKELHYAIKQKQFRTYISNMWNQVDWCIHILFIFFILVRHTQVGDIVDQTLTFSKKQSSGYTIGLVSVFLWFRLLDVLRFVDSCSFLLQSFCPWTISVPSPINSSVPIAASRSVSKRLGSMVISLRYVFVDVVTFSVIYLIWLVGFATVFNVWFGGHIEYENQDFTVGPPFVITYPSTPEN